jgi:CO dehydrogenase maturation factor
VQDQNSNEKELTNMPYSVALAGKGGSGKTTMAGMLIKYLLKKEKTPFLSVDADCNAYLN